MEAPLIQLIIYNPSNLIVALNVLELLWSWFECNMSSSLDDDF